MDDIFTYGHGIYMKSICHDAVRHCVNIIDRIYFHVIMSCDFNHCVYTYVKPTLIQFSMFAFRGCHHAKWKMTSTHHQKMKQANLVKIQTIMITAHRNDISMGDRDRWLVNHVYSFVFVIMVWIISMLCLLISFFSEWGSEFDSASSFLLHNMACH